MDNVLKYCFINCHEQLRVRYVVVWYACPYDRSRQKIVSNKWTSFYCNFIALSAVYKHKLDENRFIQEKLRHCCKTNHPNHLTSKLEVCTRKTKVMASVGQRTCILLMWSWEIGLKTKLGFNWPNRNNPCTKIICPTRICPTKTPKINHLYQVCL